MSPNASQISSIYGLLVGIAWPLVALLIVLILRKTISKLIEKDSISIQLPGGTVVQFSSRQAAEALSSVFRDFVEVYNDPHVLDAYRREVYRRILSYDKPPTVSAIIPDFDRENEMQLGCLRALRGIGLIRPEDGQKWNSDSRIVLTKFGVSLNKYLRNSY